MSQIVPEWIKNTVRRARRFFGLSGAEWNIRIHMTDKPNGKPSNDGSSFTNTRYLNSVIEFKDDLEETPENHATILHELGHVAMYEIDDVVERIIDQVPEERQSFMRGLFTEVEERYLQRLSRSLVWELGIGEEPAKESE